MRSKRVSYVANSQLVQDLTSWGLKRGLQGDYYLGGLISALKSGDQLSFWANYSPSDWLPQPKDSRTLRTAKLSRIIAMIRNVLIFAPVAITWLAIGQAARGFNKYLAEGGATTANFLEFWQDGKGVLGDFWRIGNVATTDFQIILVLILLSLLAGYLQLRSIHLSAKQDEIFEQERLELSLRIDEELSPYREISDKKVSNSVMAILEKLNTASNGIAAASEKMIQASKVLGPSISTSNRNLLDISRRVDKMLDEVRDSSNSVKKNLLSLNSMVVKKKSKIK